MRIENPRWRDTENGILAENTRVIKVFIQYPEEEKVFPFIIDKITDSRDNNFQVIKKVEATGLAFAELGKTGYKLELNDQTIKNDWKENIEALPTINYWLDKVFPNEKDVDGKITRWLTPWSYEIRMDWSGYNDGDTRARDKIYEDIHITSWNLTAGTEANTKTLTPGAISTLEEKARIIECQESNRYNITQDISETFGVFCVYEYKCDNRGQFIKTYVKEDGSAATGRTAVFYNKAIKTDVPLHFTYQHNLQTISRTLDSSELYTKLYVSPIESDIMDTGYITIADAESNPLMDDFLLNFDYMYSVGSINDFHKKTIEDYKVSLFAINKELSNLEETISNQTVKLNDLSADATSAKEGITNAHEQYNEYGILASNEIYTTPVHKDVNNRYTGIFVPSSNDGILTCKLKLDGVLIDGYEISCYRDAHYQQTEQIFSGKDLQIVPGIIAPENDQQFYAILDEYGFLESIFTSINNASLGNNPTTGAITYFDLYYCPKNKYEKVMAKFKELEDLNQAKYDNLTGKIDTLQKALDDNIARRDKLLEDKEQLNYRFERLLGGALREGYWTPDTYDDVGSLTKMATRNGSNGFLWDTEPFDEETISYYYANAEDQTADKKTYYQYIDLSGITEPIKDNFILILTKNYFTYTTGQYFVGSPSKVILDSVIYYFDLTGYTGEGHKIDLGIDPTETNAVWVKVDGTTINISTTEIADAVNLTSHFEGLNGSLLTMKLYPGAGYTLGFVNEKGTIKPIALLNNDNIDYTRYQTGKVYYQKIDKTSVFLCEGFTNLTAEQIYVYPRIFLDYKNVNYQSDEFSIIMSTTDNREDGTKITNYIDYTILLRDWKPYVSLKISENCSAQDIMEKFFLLDFRVSRANEQLYLDAKQVAIDNSQPKYSYDLSIANVPDEIQSIVLGQLAYINDYSLSIYQATGYVSGISLALDDPKEDSLTIQNYKTKFEDLFSSITASSEAMRVNKRSYDIAASGFSANGTISTTVLERSLASTNVSFNFSRTKVAIDNTGGITLTNETPYTNGVYGQVALRGGGIYCSNSIDDYGNRIWNSAITPNGINAGLITAGQLDTNIIKIYNGDNINFQWNSEGLFAYKTDSEGRPDLTQYVKYSQNGLEYINNINGAEQSTVSLGWDGLDITAQDGAVSLNGSKGLIIKNAEGQIVVALGRSDDTQPLYGLRMYQDNELNFYADNNGQLYLRKSINVGDRSGINGTAEIIDSSNNKKMMLWAGQQENQQPESSGFIVYEDGSIKATSGKIGSLTIDAIESSVNSYTIKVVSSAGYIYDESVVSTAVLTAEIYQSGLRISIEDLPDGSSFQWQNSTDKGTTWNNLSSTTDTLTIQATKDILYRCNLIIPGGD